MIELSDRINALSESATIAMAQKARDFKARGIDIINLSLGEPDFKTPLFIQEAAKKAIDDGKYFTYPPVPGYADLREAIAKKLREENNIPSTAEQIVISTGAKQSIANVVMCTINPGDEVILFTPYWVSYAEIVRLAGGDPVLVKGTLENNFKPTAGQVEAAINDKTKLIIYSSPCNPTGAVLTRTELEALADVMRKYPQVLAVADEIYELINFTEDKVSLAALPDMADRVVTVNGFSKGYAMTGWRIGYINAPLAVAKACSKMQGQFTSGTNGIAQRAALAAITGPKADSEQMAAAYRRRRDMVLDLLRQIPGIKTYTPTGAFYFFPDVSEYFGKSDGERTIKNADDLAMYLLEVAHVSLVTGEAFGAPECIRISYAASEDELKEALKRIREALSTLK